VECGVGGRVLDTIHRALMFLAELQNDLSDGGDLVAQNASTRPVHERVDHIVREAVRIRRHRLRCHDAHQLPVAGRRVLALRPLDQATCDVRRAGLRPTTFERLDVSEAEPLETREVDAADRARDPSEPFRALVTAFRRIGKLSRAIGVEHDDARSRHAAILGWS